MTRVVAALDRNEELAFLPMRDDAAAELLEPLPEAERFASWHLALPDGPLVGHGTGGVELLRSVRLTRRAARLLALVPNRMLDGLYRVVASRRGALGRFVPNGPAPRRYP